MMEQDEEPWLFRAGDLAKTPSREDGISMEEEMNQRQEGARFIHDVGRKLRLPRITIATACIFFHRFYMYRSLRDYKRHDIAACSLFLAGKVEETPKKVRDVVMCCAQEAGGSVPEENSKEFHELRDKLLRQECVLLQTLSFDLTVEHPYDFLLSFVKVLKGDRTIAQYAWNFLNDSMYATTLCLQYPPQAIACAMLEFAARIAKRPWPTRAGSNWWTSHFLVQASSEDIEDIISQLRKIYDDETYTSMKHEIRQALEQADRGNAKRAPETVNGSGHRKRQRKEEPETIAFEP